MAPYIRERQAQLYYSSEKAGVGTNFPRFKAEQAKVLRRFRQQDGSLKNHFEELPPEAPLALHESLRGLMHLSGESFAHLSESFVVGMHGSDIEQGGIAVDQFSALNEMQIGIIALGDDFTGHLAIALDIGHLPFRIPRRRHPQ
jgi:hypothetical protein